MFGQNVTCRANDPRVGDGVDGILRVPDCHQCHNELLLNVPPLYRGRVSRAGPWSRISRSPKAVRAAMSGRKAGEKEPPVRGAFRSLIHL
jgi:hypothetical protein